MKQEHLPEPTVAGQYGRAWPMDTMALRRNLNVRPEDDALLVSWVIEAPWAHPLWHSYALHLVHLRPMPDNRPTVIHVPGATHETTLFALDPGYPRTLDWPCHYLTPANFAAQLVEDSDAVAEAVVRQTVTDICAGLLNPDTDATSQWVQRFGDSMLKKWWESSGDE